MSYFILAGGLGLSYLAYQKRKDLTYNLLSAYTKVEDIFTPKKKNNNNEYTVEYFYINDDELVNTSDINKIDISNNIIDSNKDYFVLRKIQLNDKIFHQLIDPFVLSEDLYKFDIEYFKKYLNNASQILSCTFNLYDKDQHILKEYDISIFIDTFIFGNQVLNLNKSSINIILHYIKKYYKLDFKVPESEDLRFEFIILDRNIELIKGNDMSFLTKNNYLTIDKKN